MRKVSFLDIFRSHGSWLLKLIKTIDHSLGALVAAILPARKRTNIPEPIRKILIIRPGGIGDAVFLLPILKALKDQGVSVDILCERRNAEVFLSQGYTCYLYHRASSLFEAFKRSYDAVIDTEQWHYLSAVIGYFIKADHHIGFGTRSLRAKLFDQAVAYGPDDYELDNFVRLFDGLLKDEAALDINNCFIVPEDLKAWASQQVAQGGICIFLGASIPLKRIPQEKLLGLIRGLLLKNETIVLLGGQDVSGLARQIAAEINSPRLLNFAGKVFLTQSAALIQRSRRFIGADSGLLHLACAVGVPVTAVFGPTSLKKWQPKGKRHTVITENVPCSPCTHFSYTLPTCQGSYHCMKGLKLDSSIS